MSDLSVIARELFLRGLIKLGEFKLSSGRLSPYYIDLRILPSHPELYRIVMNNLMDMILSDRIVFDVVAGIETSGIVHAAYLGCLMSKPIAYVRKEGKKHGTGNLVEGLVNGKRVLLVDDVSTTGSTLVKAVEALRNHGAMVEYAVVLIDRCEGAVDKLRENGVVLKPLFKITDILENLHSQGLISREVYVKILKYMESAR